MRRTATVAGLLAMLLLAGGLRCSAETAGFDASKAPPPDKLYVGSGCQYATIAAAITAASPGDIIRLEGGRTFYENVTVDKNLEISGGYAGCNSGSRSACAPATSPAPPPDAFEAGST